MCHQSNKNVCSGYSDCQENSPRRHLGRGRAKRSQRKAPEVGASRSHSTLLNDSLNDSGSDALVGEERIMHDNKTLTQINVKNHNDAAMPLNRYGLDRVDQPLLDLPDMKYRRNGEGDARRRIDLDRDRPSSSDRDEGRETQSCIRERKRAVGSQRQKYPTYNAYDRHKDAGDSQDEQNQNLTRTHTKSGYVEKTQQNMPKSTTRAYTEFRRQHGNKENTRDKQRRELIEREKLKNEYDWQSGEVKKNIITVGKSTVQLCRSSFPLLPNVVQNFRNIVKSISKLEN